MTTQHDRPWSLDAAAAARLPRRELLRAAALGAGAAGLGALLAACSHKSSSGGGGGSAPAGSLGALTAGTQQLSLLNAQSNLPVGKSLMTFGLATPDNRLVVGGQPEMWAARADGDKALGPFPVRSYQLSSYGPTGDKSPKTDLSSYFAAEVDIPSAGNWLLVATIDVGGQRSSAKGAMAVLQQVVAQVGTKATATPSPVATTPAALRKICTRQPPCHLHTISLDKAISSGRPTVVAFATPLLCQSRMCGPVVDEVIVAAGAIGTAKANFIHVEEFLQPHGKPDNSTDIAPAFRAWKFETEPWTIVIDKAGVIRVRFEGPVTADQVEKAVRPLLV